MQRIERISQIQQQRCFFDTAPGCFERHRSHQPLLTPIRVIRAVDPPDGGVVAVAARIEQEMISIDVLDRCSGCWRSFKKVLSFTPIRLIRQFPTDP
jgi:hypothetical protein